ncbi:hypothetical protein AN7637.2 [Aspergillus nidulans FGSC A4]|uniref:ubiquitinyl hydrolase 1 n=1 Tax=Emericella nidulans (strain FGSC A4 / ATCC 38163 / CBS 112.46 / NRRL 194 / M139) TaxID=227321 RepID=Q5AVP3_EMENI|nr:hypothetical protein [Aspergillus nidulans FGSC A4]EAA61823.1 hypothetical protein AN7637.2 [Aspergillus nidulans FGSC A4]CBF79793.1 TPA: conserved hypothetical protein [Aspergillus nidulans FGSC A4]|eukprot:XP_680906.1 hypothetical protein AN7637.2 [Aspergillus nidulans FGSC A4]
MPTWESGLRSIFNHVVLPPELPGHADEHPEAVEKELMRRLLNTVTLMKTKADEELFPTWQILENTLKLSSIVNEGVICNKAALIEALKKVGSENAVIVRVQEQNAGLLIRHDEAGVIFEAFEISGSAEQTLAAKGALQWDFPGCAVSLPHEIFSDHSFQANLAMFLEKASVEYLPQFAAKVRKAGKDVTEDRDTCDPALITQCLMTLLEANGKRLSVPCLRKRVNDDVCWNQAKVPWRRSPMWLTLRVCLQRLLHLQLGEAGRVQYKNLMCMLLAKLLDDCVRVLSSEHYHLLKVKLCRRLAKLEAEKESGSAQVHMAYTAALRLIEPYCMASIDAATSAIHKEWNFWKQDIQRQIPKLPSCTPSDCYLTLPNSIEYLKNIFHPRQHKSPQASFIEPCHLDSIVTSSTTKQFAALTKRYSVLADREAAIASDAFELPSAPEAITKQCIDLASSIGDYMETVGDAYDDDPEQFSLFILSIFDMWVAMDRAAIKAYPVLKDFHPWFNPELLDVLLLERLKDMRRLQSIQFHLQSRCTEAKYGKMTIFGDPMPGCFAERYFDSPSAGPLHKLRQRILKASQEAEDYKRKELEEINRSFTHLTDKLRSTSCTFLRNPDGSHDIRGCIHCYYLRSRRRLKIDVHENYLPFDLRGEVQQKAILFELQTPKALAAYREVTWNIVNRLCAKPSPSDKGNPELLLADYTQLKIYREKRAGTFSLASPKKSFIGTHYRWKGLPADVQDIILPHGPEYYFYDSGRELWFSDYPQQLSFAHHFVLRIPKESPFSCLYSSSCFAPDTEGPSSYKIAANISECPTALTVHEFTAHQTITGGRNRRWLSILAELGSSNINFGLQETMILFHHLALQAGPRLEHTNFRAVHVMFRDEQFCQRMTEQVSRHAESIATNHREHNMMETLLTLCLRLFSLGSAESRFASKRVLQKIRQITMSWIKLLRDETRKADDVNVVNTAARYCFLSALLCRRSFTPWLTSQAPLDPESLRCFFDASLAMQESLVADLSLFSNITRNMLIRDIKMTSQMSVLISTSAMQEPNSIGAAIDAAWPQADNKPRKYGEWRLLSHPYENWVTSQTDASDDILSQRFYFHLLQGHLVVDGKTIGKLPADIRDSPVLKELFGSQRLFALPSNLPGMEWTLLNSADGHRIHLAHRGEQLIIRAEAYRSILELVPRSVFGRGPNFDLPYPLIIDCIHWMDLRTGILEVRQKPRIWKRREGNWKIDIRTRKCERKRVTLVDPFSSLARQISQVFQHFEQSNRITIIRTPKTLIVELKRLNLDFSLTKWGSLKCHQLGALIDRDQDPGTFYGLQSMLVLRDDRSGQRSILVPLGDPSWTRHGSHVRVKLESNGIYVKYTINNVLRRLECPANPRLLYVKAQLHALTSHLLPDPLTGRTGTQEALDCLRSGFCQPWVPLSSDARNILHQIASLTPRREYYPKVKRRQQRVFWNPHLTANIQHEGFYPLVEVIIKRSEILSRFSTKQADSINESTMPVSISHLRERAHRRRSIFEAFDFSQPALAEDTPYVARDGWSSSRRVTNVREVVTLLLNEPSAIHTTRNLMGLLESWPSIGGYSNTCTYYNISDYLSLNVAEEWGGLVNMSRKSRKEDVHNLIFKLGVIAFQDGVNMTALRVIASFFVFPEFRSGLQFPHFPSFVRFARDEKPTVDSLLPLIRMSYPARPMISRRHRVYKDSALGYEANCEKEGVELAKLLIRQWPCAEPSAEYFEPKDIDKAQAMKALLPEWTRIYHNLHFQGHIEKVQTILNHHYRVYYDFAPMAASSSIHKEYLGPKRKFIFVSYPKVKEDLLAKPALGLLETLGLPKETAVPEVEEPPTGTQDSNTLQSPSPHILELENIVHQLGRSECPVKFAYAQDLEQSIAALKTIRDTDQLHRANPLMEKGTLDQDIIISRNKIKDYYDCISNSLSASDETFKWLSIGNLWPTLTPTTILQQLRSTSRHEFGPDMKELFVSYALAIAKLQKLLRLKEAATKREENTVNHDCTDPGHVNWNPFDFPDWILLEIDANFQIRQDQVTVAMEMISPSSGSNSVLQMNMGQGKTSVIMPMVAAVLANGEVLSRLLVPKALLSQAAQILQSRLGGLLGRDIVHVPFSRRTRTTHSLLEDYRQLHEGTLLSSGIILGVPEHILSFKLSGLQRLADSKLPEAGVMIDTQKWLEEVSRDVIDEADFTLAVKTQLIYPGGSQLAVDGHPERWEVAMTLLGLCACYLKDLSKEYPRSIDILERNSTGFPVTYILRKDVEHALVHKIAQDICNEKTSLLPLRDCNKMDKEAIRLFITEEKVEKSVTKRVAKLFPDTPKLRKVVYLLRGLLVHGILILCLKKRWNVEYGLHPGRDPIAVPFHAKGVPSEQAEWGHPDVAILFTCLAFYYEGLSQQQLKKSLGAVLKSDHPFTEYERWTQTSATLPEALRHWAAITVDDAGLVAEIWRHLRYTREVINHFLSNFVFPLHARQFATKLSASGWDLILSRGSQYRSTDGLWVHPGFTTGFSGTNDNRRLLPLTIEQCDLPGLSHTNAEVLTYLLQPRNRCYRVAIGPYERRMSENALLEYLYKENIRVLIDAGAFIMEMNNETVAKTWLQADWKAKGAVYFGDDNIPWVMYRNFKRAPLFASPFADDLSEALVYLDEARSRGVDLRFPPSAVGALTLGLGQTKDHTVQAAMRLRQLGSTQSVTFIAPPEVHQSILHVCNKTSKDKLDSSDVVAWLLDQTCAVNLELSPLYFAQGKDFTSRLQAATAHKMIFSNVEHRTAYLRVLQQPEQQTLEQLYEPTYREETASSLSVTTFASAGKVGRLMQALEKRRLESHKLASVISSALEQVEQEREVAYEIEEEREIQRPSQKKALRFPGLHESILNFAKGEPLGSSGILSASEWLEKTHLGEKYKIEGSSLVSHLHLSAEFSRTVKLKNSEKSDTYIRPVNWLLYNTVTETALVIISEEAEILIPIMRASTSRTTHLILYAAPWTKSMLHFNNLTYYSLPSLRDGWTPPTWLPFELGIIAGRLYFPFSEYEDASNPLYSLARNPDGEDESLDSWAKNHLNFLQEWLAIRRQGQDVTDTPMGYICQNWPLRREHPFFATRSAQEGMNAPGLECLRFTMSDQEEEYYSSDEDLMEVNMGGNVDDEVHGENVGIE